MSDDTIRHVINNNPTRFEALVEAVTMLIGPNNPGNRNEIDVVDTADGPLVVHAMVGTSGEAARQRYGQPVTKH